MRDHLDECVLYHSGELGETECVAFERHKAACPACRELLEALALGARAAQAAALALPPAARARAIGAARAVPARGRPALALALAVALAALWVRSPRTAAVPSWTGMDREVARVDRELSDLSASVARSETDVEIEEQLRGLDTEARQLRKTL
jgi:hypothetical protein